MAGEDTRSTWVSRCKASRAVAEASSESSQSTTPGLPLTNTVTPMRPSGVLVTRKVWSVVCSESISAFPVRFLLAARVTRTRRAWGVVEPHRWPSTAPVDSLGALHRVEPADLSAYRAARPSISRSESAETLTRGIDVVVLNGAHH